MDDKNKIEELIHGLSRLCEELPSEAKTTGEYILSQLQAFHDEYIDFRTILNGLNEQFFITDAKEKTVFVNNAYCKAAKLHPEQLIGKTISTLVEKDHLFQNPIIPKVLEEKKEMQIIAQVRTQDDPVCLIGTPIFDSTGALCYAVSNDYRPEDITGLQYHFARFTEQKEMQKKTAELNYYRHQISANKNYYFADSQMQEISELVKLIGNTDVTVLITGESGTGKEVISDLLYQSSSRSDQPFIKVNCAAIPDSLLESELFGYEKGAFTGADKNGKIGLIELADKGTLLLDEIGEIPHSFQTKLLRTIQEKKIRRVGGTKEIPIDIRILAATNKDLQKEVREGHFREDLYYRLNVVPIRIPALRERPKDIRLLTDRFLEQYTVRYRKNIQLSDKARTCLQQYDWPGNIRELKNIIERLVVTNTSGEINEIIIQNTLGIRFAAPEPIVPTPIDSPDLNLKNAREQLEIEYIKTALMQFGSKRQAAKALGIDHSTLVLKCQKYKI